MAKDPAFLFYSNDFSSGTQFFTDEQVGKFIRLMIAQHQHGHLTEKQVLHICKSYDNEVMEKFVKDDAGKFYNLRLEDEILKRKAYTESRGRNKQGKTKSHDNDIKNISKSYDLHMENENENENRNKIKSIEDRKTDFFNKVGLSFSADYDNTTLNDFCEYWTECSEGGKKLRWEMEKVFDVGRRLKTWSKNNFNKKSNGKQQSQSITADELREIAERNFTKYGAGKNI